MVRFGLMILLLLMSGCGSESKDFADARPTRKLDRTWRESAERLGVADVDRGPTRISQPNQSGHQAASASDSRPARQR